MKRVGTVMTSVIGSASQGGVTSLVTTGPDGAPMDEASQQSTLSNASAGVCHFYVQILSVMISVTKYYQS